MMQWEHNHPDAQFALLVHEVRAHDDISTAFAFMWTNFTLVRLIVGPFVDEIERLRLDGKSPIQPLKRETDPAVDGQFDRVLRRHEHWDDAVNPQIVRGARAFCELEHAPRAVRTLYHRYSSFRHVVQAVVCTIDTYFTVNCRT